ncbi:MAG: DUF4214 domain-containing protein [Rhodoferax sp.]|nr:DUF4214 domain-containing protein [Rhodoferax sp.]
MATVTGTSNNDTLLGSADFDSFTGLDGNDSVDAGGGNDTLSGGLGNDALNGSGGFDTAIFGSGTSGVTVNLATGTASGGDGNDTLVSIENITGSAYDDSLTGDDAVNTLNGGKGGNDTLVGGAGIDTAVYDGERSNYTITITAAGVTVTTGGASDTLSGVERLQFQDRLIDVDIGDHVWQTYRLYQAAFNRAPDGGGLKYWAGQMENGVNLYEIASQFINSAEFQSLYGNNPTNQQFVANLYNNVLHRAPDQGGIDYWVGQLDNHARTQAEVLASFAESSENQVAVIGSVQGGIDL